MRAAPPASGARHAKEAPMDRHALRIACRELVETSPAAYLTTIGGDGYPRTRAMLNLRNRAQYPRRVRLYAGHEADLLVHFTTNTSSHKATQIAANPRAAVYHCDPAAFGALCWAAIWR